MTTEWIKRPKWTTSIKNSRIMWNKVKVNKKKLFVNMWLLFGYHTSMTSLNRTLGTVWLKPLLHFRIVWLFDIMCRWPYCTSFDYTFFTFSLKWQRLQQQTQKFKIHCYDLYSRCTTFYCKFNACYTYTSFSQSGLSLLID